MCALRRRSSEGRQLTEAASAGYFPLAFSALTRAQRAFVAARMLARPAALSFRFGLAVAVGLAGCPAFALAQRAFAPAAILALASALYFRLTFVGAAVAVTGAVSAPFSFAQRAFCAAAIFALVAALKCRLPGAVVTAGVVAPDAPSACVISASLASMVAFSCWSAARRATNCSTLLVFTGS